MAEKEYKTVTRIEGPLVFVEKTPTAFKYTDELDSKTYREYAEAHENAMVTVFRDGDICNEESFKTIRNRLANEE